MILSHDFEEAVAAALARAEARAAALIAAELPVDVTLAVTLAGLAITGARLATRSLTDPRLRDFAGMAR